jgi:quercetin dioxygenase-like cupin family protein
MESSSYWLFGAKMIIRTDESSNGNLYDIIEGTFPAGAKTPPHVHSEYAETVVALEGELIVYTPGNKHVLKAGDTHFIPKNMPHAIENNSDIRPFKALAIATPSGFAHLIRSIGFPDKDQGTAPDMQHDMELATRVMAEIGDKIIGPVGMRP